MPMSVQDHSGHQEQAREGMSVKSKAGLVLVGFLVIAGALLFTEHRAHVLGPLVWLPLLACPLLHVFMHGGMATTEAPMNRMAIGGHHERRRACLWFVGPCNCQPRRLHLLYLLQAATPRDWRSFGAFSAFLVALFTEMYGFPLTIYSLSGWLQSRYPDVDWFSHDAGHFLQVLFGWKANPHGGPFHILSFLFIGAERHVRHDPGRTRGQAAAGRSRVLRSRSVDLSITHNFDHSD
jgi:hypothetical protein